MAGTADMTNASRSIAAKAAWAVVALGRFNNISTVGSAPVPQPARYWLRGQLPPAEASQLPPPPRELLYIK